MTIERELLVGNPKGKKPLVRHTYFNRSQRNRVCRYDLESFGPGQNPAVGS
jgi:hypothetical protein